MKIIVKNKMTYFCLVLPVVAIIKFFAYDLSFLDNIATFGYQLFLSLLIAAIGIYLFISFNTYSHWMNPNHPKE